VFTKTFTLCGNTFILAVSVVVKLFETRVDVEGRLGRLLSLKPKKVTLSSYAP